MQTNTAFEIRIDALFINVCIGVIHCGDKQGGDQMVEKKTTRRWFLIVLGVTGKIFDLLVPFRFLLIIRNSHFIDYRLNASLFHALCRMGQTNIFTNAPATIHTMWCSSLSFVGPRQIDEHMDQFFM